MDTDTEEYARAVRLRRRIFGLAGLFLVLLTVGTSLIFAGYPNLGITLVALSPLALVVIVWLFVRG